MKDIEDAFRRSVPLEVEPWVELAGCKDFESAQLSSAAMVKLNQQRRQGIKFEFFKNTFDYLSSNSIIGDYFEFGVHKVRTFRMALTCAQYYSMDGISFHAFDSFEGMPKTENNVLYHWRPGALCTSLDQFKEITGEHGLYLEDIHTHKGFYEDSLNQELSLKLQEKGTRASFINIDCDLYESAVQVFKFIEPFLIHGTVIYLDDAFAGFKADSSGGVLEAWNRFSAKSKFRFLENSSIGWWGKSFIASE